MSVFIKDADAQLDYVVDWSEFLASGETIATAQFIVPVGLTQPFPPTSDITSATVWLAGGTAGEVYVVTCRITTSNAPPRIQDQTFTIWVRET